jgi:hypothetical protein
VHQTAIAETTSDNSGAFYFSAVKPGGYFISMFIKGFREHAESVTVQEGQTVNVGKQILRIGLLNDELLPVDIPPRPSGAEKLTHIPKFYDAYTMTVCEFIKERPALSANRFPYQVIIMGTLVQTPNGSWLQQTCVDSLKSGNFIWPNAIALKEGNNDVGKALIQGKSSWRVFPYRLNKPADKEIDPRDRSERWVAVYGELDTRDSLVAAPCGNEGRLCGYGYGAISAPVQLTYYNFHFFDEKSR